MTRHLPLLAALAVALAACGGTSFEERAIEEAIERGVDGAGDVDLDFGDDGSFSIDIDVDGDGEPDSIGFDVDEDGSFTVGGDLDGDGEDDTVQFDADGDGGGELSFDDVDGESGTVQIEGGDDGSITIDADGDAGDGSFEFDTTTEIPDDWPGDVPEPEGVAIENVTTFDGGDTGTQIAVTGTVENGAEWAESYGAELEGAGFAESFSSRSEGQFSAGYGEFGSGSAVMVVNAFENGDGTWTATISVTTEG